MESRKYILVLTIAVAIITLFNDSLFASDTDDRIVASAKQSYVFKTYLKNDDITVISKDGAVTLTGTVADEPKKTLAKETAASLPGVKSVDNQLTLRGAPPRNELGHVAHGQSEINTAVSSKR